MKEEDERKINEYLQETLQNEKVLEMKNYIQHGHITTFEHAKNVARISFLLNQKLHLKSDVKALLVGAMLHDFYLYDWHIKNNRRPLHGTHHSQIAMQNAKEFLHVGIKEQQIILTHMWPLTLCKIPKTREAWIVCIADKLSAINEMFEK